VAALATGACATRASSDLTDPAGASGGAPGDQQVIRTREECSLHRIGGNGGRSRPVENLIVRFRDALASFGETAPTNPDWLRSGKAPSQSIDTFRNPTHHNGPMGSFGEADSGRSRLLSRPIPPKVPLGSFGNTSLASFGDRLGRGCEKRRRRTADGRWGE
jgi:hypothetical protein